MKIKTIFFALSFIFLVFFFFPLLSILLNTYFGLPQYINRLVQIIGFILMLLGTTLIFYCINIFRLRGKGTPVPANPPNKLVKSGLYQYTRNPMHIGYLITIFGLSLFFGYLLLYVYLVLLFIFLNSYLVFVEEPALIKRFDKKYKEYLKKVPRWF